MESSITVVAQDQFVGIGVEAAYFARLAGGTDPILAVSECVGFRHWRSNAHWVHPYQTFGADKHLREIVKPATQTSCHHILSEVLANYLEMFTTDNVDLKLSAALLL